MELHINSGLKQKEIISILENDGIPNVKANYLGKSGITLKFDIETQLLGEEIQKTVKEMIKKEEWGKTIFFNVNVI